MIHQELVRKLCPDCSVSREPRPHEAALFEQGKLPVPDQVLDAAGCEQCYGRGYRGRTGVFQIVVVNDAMARRLAQDGQTWLDDQDSRGDLGIAVDALRKVADGVTSMSEAIALTCETIETP